MKSKTIIACLCCIPAVSAILPDAAHADCRDTGFSMGVGIGVHDSALDGPEFALNNPIGIVAMKYQTDSPVSFNARHMSGITQQEQGYGSNVISIEYTLFPFK